MAQVSHKVQEIHTGSQIHPTSDCQVQLLKVSAKAMEQVKAGEQEPHILSDRHYPTEQLKVHPQEHPQANRQAIVPGQVDLHL